MNTMATAELSAGYRPVDRLYLWALLDPADPVRRGREQALQEARAVAQVVSGWKEHFAACAVTAADIALYAEQIDRPFLRDQREEASR